MVYKPLHSVVLIKAVRYSYMYINFRSQNFYTFLVIWTHVLLSECIARRLFLLVNNIVYIIFFQETYLQ